MDQWGAQRPSADELTWPDKRNQKFLSRFIISQKIRRVTRAIDDTAPVWSLSLQTYADPQPGSASCSQADAQYSSGVRRSIAVFVEGIARRDRKLLLFTLGASWFAGVPGSASRDGNKD
jgi:hypothetical protein